jgi:F-type H+-transporting ATPase subunit epsilon
MNLLKAYFDGWRVLLRVLAFTLCMSLFALPVVLAVCIFLRLGDCPATQALLTTPSCFTCPSRPTWRRGTPASSASAPGKRRRARNWRHRRDVGGASVRDAALVLILTPSPGLPLPPGGVTFAQKPTPMPLLLEIVTPESKVYSEMVDHVVVPTVQGEIDVLPGHIPLLSVMQPGELRVGKGGNTSLLAVDKGFVQVRGDKVSVLTDAAINIEAIDLAALDKAREEAERALADARTRNEDASAIEELETKARFAVVQRLIKESKR